MIPIAFNHLLRRFSQAGPPAFDLNRRFQKMLPLLVDGAFYHSHDQSETAAGFVPGTFHVQTQQCNPLARTGFLKGLGRLGSGEPGGLVLGSCLTARIPFDKEIETTPQRAQSIPLGGMREEQAGSVESTVAARQYRHTGWQLSFGTRKDTFEKVFCLECRVLFAGAQFESDAPAFVTQIGGNRGIAVKAMIGATDFFILCAAIVHGEGIKVEAEPSPCAQQSALRCTRTGAGWLRRCDRAIALPCHRAAGAAIRCWALC